MANIKCPYPQHILDEVAGINVTNDRYYAWCEGYEAHKLETLELVESLQLLRDALRTEISVVREMKKEYQREVKGNGHRSKVRV